MYVRNLLTLGLATAAVVACSKPSTDGTSALDPDFEADLELALFGAAESERTDGPVVSALELGREAGDVELPAPQPAPAANPTASAAAAPAPDEPQPDVATRMEPADEPDAEAVEEPVVAMAGGADRGDHGGAHRGPVVGPAGGRIIIRGGVIGTDPCIRHHPVDGAIAIGPGGIGNIGVTIGDVAATLGGVGALVNDQAPRVHHRGPRTDRGGWSGMPGPRGGGLFAGGIR